MKVEIIISELDFWIKENIRVERIKAGIDQVELAQRIGVSEGHIGNIENPKNPTKANIRLLGRIAIALGLESYDKLLPKNVVKNDMVRIKLNLMKVNSRKQILNENGNVPKRLEIISITPLSEFEMELFKKNELPYISKVS